MGCAGSSMSDGGDPESQARNKAIEAGIEKDRLRLKNQVKLLILGTGESGKSTVMKQMVILHNGGFSDEERHSYAEIVYSNTIQSMQAVLEALPLLKLSLEPQNEDAAALLEELDPDERSVDPTIRAALMALWSDPALKESMNHQAEFQLNNSAEYFFDNIARTTNRSYIPTDDDIIRSRVRTTGIMETRFMIGKLEYRIFDVGGQRSERKKWLHAFESVDVLLFIVAISEFDQTLYEDETVYRMEEAMVVFGSVSNSRWFAKSTLILFLNKIDLFKEKLGKSSIKAKFPAYTGSETDYEEASDFFLREFKQLYKQPKPLYAHYTEATSTKTIQVINVVADTITRQMFADSGLI